MYKYVRCNLLHEGEMHEKIIFQNVGYFKVNSDSSIVLPLAYLEALIASIISSNVNKNEKMENDFYVYYGNYLANLNDYWGDENKMREAIRNGFLYNVEEMINRKKNQ